MAGRWSSEIVVAEYKDLQANCMAVDCSGKHALLSGRKLLAVVELDKPTENIRKIPRQSKWEVSATQWNPHSSHSNLLVTASNQKAEVIGITEGTITQQCSLKAHTRVISDLDWSKFEPNIITTCSVDTYAFIWDIRDARKPAISLQAVAGASQVKWNRVSGNLLATTHDGDIRIWDPRKSTSPIQYIAAHLSKIHGLDWSPNNELQLATSSQDCTVKFWDVNNPRRATSVLSSASPVWRARYTPFGTGLVTVVVPQLRRGENSLVMWNTNSLTQAKHTFVGHTDVILDFHWRCIQEGTKDYQLVTWSRDQSLRIWKVDPQLQRMCGHEVLDLSGELEGVEQGVSPVLDASSPVDSNTLQVPDSKLSGEALSVTPPGVPVPIMVKSPQNQMPKNLQQEFLLVNIDIPNVTVNEMDHVARTCTITAISGKHVVKLIMSFPAAYPNNAAPSFQFGTPNNLEKTVQAKVIKVLQDTSLLHIKHNRSCLEPCLRQLVSFLDNLTMEERKTPDSDTPYNLQQAPVASAIQTPSFMPLYNYSPYSSFTDSGIPFPRTSGARFCGSGYLVMFTRHTHKLLVRKISSNEKITPRAMSALSQFAQPPQQAMPNINLNIGWGLYGRSPPTSDVSISNYYHFKDKKQRSSQRTRGKLKLKDGTDFRTGRGDNATSPKKHQKPARKAGPVVIYNTGCLLPIQRQLGEKYVIDSDNIEEACTKNANLAASLGRKDLAQMWSMVAIANNKMLKPGEDPDKGAPWAMSPFGRNLIESLIEYYSSLYDVQTLAMLCAVFSEKCDPRNPPVLPPTQMNRSTSQDPAAVQVDTDSHYLTIHSSGVNSTWNISAVKLKRSSSWTEAFEDYNYNQELGFGVDSKQLELEQHEANMLILDPAKRHQYDAFKKAYANILYQWGLMEQRNEILKFVSTPPEPHKGIEFVTVCHHCRKEVRGAQCGSCKYAGLQCSICHIAVKGSSNFCLSCGHGGHTGHILDWFQTHDVCPTGCGCSCIDTYSGHFRDKYE
ncbi:unnamed protein product [Owenia fusiformis]|uniref:Uncharacterized protein n=1 Tax=Owenia fusiformis TaxID=6347 RepID=A0A8J1Y8H9_OWEFU|nr:unnamed protein product [Owenia fusiformis]